MYQKMLLSDKVVESIENAIKNGFYKIGDQMPNEIQLSEELGVSRATLREAIKILISKNVFEVKRGIGTFVSQTPGFSVDALGLEFIDLNHQINEIQRTMRYMDFEELSAFPHLSYEMQTNIRDGLRQYGGKTSQLLAAIFEATEKIALFRQSTFKHRMILLSHEAFIKAVDLNQNLEDELLKKVFDTFVETLGEERMNTHYDDFITRVRLIEQEA